MSDILLEQWPQCHWCGEPLGELSLEVETSRDNKRCICQDCREIMNAAIAEYAPFYLGEFLRHYTDSNKTLETYPSHRDLSPDDIQNMVRANIEKSLEACARDMNLKAV